MAPSEKPTIAINSTQLNNAESSHQEGDHLKKNPTNWRPGYLARFPWFGVAGLLGVLICAVILIAILVCSDGASSSQWRLQPSIIISGLCGLSNLCLALAIAEGIAIAWWRKALRGATVAELHQSWALSMSFRNVIQHFWRLDVIALAALAAKLAILDGILFQRASTTYTTQDPARNVTLLGAAATDFPQTGYVVAQGFGAQTDCNCFMIGDSYTPTVDTWETSNGFFKDFDQLFPVCDGICYSHVDAIGFDIDCQKSVNHTNYATSAIDAYQKAGGKGDSSSQWTDLPIFNSSFGVVYPTASANYPSLALDLLYFDSDNPYDPNSDSCPGTITTVQCKLRPALIRYPLTVVKYTNAHITNGVSIGGRPHDDSNTASPPVSPYSYTNKQTEGFTVVSYLDSTDTNTINSTTQLGGIANALGQFMTSSATITYTGGSLWGLTQKGILAQSMMFGPPNMGSCDCSFHDALSTLVSGINQLTFLTATSLISRPNSTTPINAGTAVTVMGISTNTTTTFTPLPSTLQIKDAIHYHTNYLFLGLGLASILICILLIVPSFWRYGELGRPVTLGPMEIASAFRAPMLETGVAGAKAAGNLDELIKQVGDRRVVYGFVEEEARVGGGAEKRETLCMETPARVRPVSHAFGSPPMSPLSSMSPTGSRWSGGKI